MPIPITMRAPQFVGDGRITFTDKPVPAPGGHAIAQRIRPDIESLLVAGAGLIRLGVLAMAILLLGAAKPGK